MSTLLKILKKFTNVSKVKGKRQSNPEIGLRGLEGSGRLRLPDF
jgi:hypothetical protein